MIKLLIVDDEQIEREAMKAILQKTFSDLVIELAKNGKVALEKAEIFKPDLVLMDIKMPGMNGLEAVKRISKDYPTIKFIMVTAYDTFDYARSAIKLGVKDYLLKPSNLNEIKETVGRVLNEIEEERETKQDKLIQNERLQTTLSLVETDVVTQLLFDHVHEVHLDMLYEMLDIKSTNEMFVMNVLVPVRSENLYVKIKEKVRQTKSGWMGALYDSQIPIILFHHPEISYRAQAVSLAKEILLIPAPGLLDDWFIGIGRLCDSLEDIRQSYQEALIASMDKSYSTRYRFFDEIPNPININQRKQLIYEEKGFSDQVRLGQWEEIRNNIINLIQSFENERIDLQEAQQSILEVLWFTWRILRETGLETMTPRYSFQTQNYRQLRSETSILIEEMRRSYVKHYESIEADTIHQLKQYIMEYSHQDITLDTLANMVGLSPIYISKMFKEKIGVNYIDFLTECRIEKAKKLMANPEKSIKEITFDVGYHEPNYFSKVFKKTCNVSPKEYRQKLLGKNMEQYTIEN